LFSLSEENIKIKSETANCLLLFYQNKLWWRFLIHIRDAPDTDFAGYPTGRISGKGQIPDIRPDTWLDKYIFG
jgi:hypothetical protein